MFLIRVVPIKKRVCIIPFHFFFQATCKWYPFRSRILSHVPKCHAAATGNYECGHWSVFENLFLHRERPSDISSCIRLLRWLSQFLTVLT